MSGCDIRSEYICLFDLHDEGERLDRLRRLLEQARTCGEVGWTTLIEARIAVVERDFELAIRLCAGLVDASDTAPDLRLWARLASGFAFGKSGDAKAAIADYTAVIDDPAAPAEQKAKARFNRGVAFGKSGDAKAEIADYTAVIDDPAAPAEQKAKARVYRGITFGESGDAKAEIADYTAVIDDPAAPAEQKASARVNRGIAFGKSGDAKAAIADYTAVIDDPAAPADPKASARVNRGIAFGKSGDAKAAIADYTAVIDDPAAPADPKASARFNRGIAFGKSGDAKAAIADYTAVIDDPAAPADPKASARVNRGIAFGKSGDAKAELADYTAVIDDPAAPAEQKAKARVYRGITFGESGDAKAEIADYTAVIDDPAAPADPKASARVNRGVAFGESGDAKAEIADYTAVIDDPAAPAKQKAKARVYRGITFGESGDAKAAIADFTAVIDDPAAPAKQKAKARFNRGVAFGKSGDAKAEMADYTAVIDDPAAPAKQKASARFNRGVAFGKSGDAKAAIADYTAVIDDPAAPADPKASARFNRGVAFGKSGDANAEIADYTAVIDDPAAPAEQQAKARVGRGIAFGESGDAKAELADYTSVIDDPAAPAEQKALARFNRAVAFGEMPDADKASADFRAVFSDGEAPVRLRSEAQMYWTLWSQDRSGKSFDAAKNLDVELDEKTKREFREKLDAERKRKRDFFGESQFQPDCSFLLVAREWNSFTPAIPELGEPSRGGGYYLRHRGVGIVVDPGFDFLQIFAQAGGKLCDINHVVITHAHNDHTAEFESILTLLYAYNNPGPEEPPRSEKHSINVYLNQGAARKFAGMLPLRDSKEIHKVVTLSYSDQEHPFVVPIAKDIYLTVLPAYHDEVLTQDSSVGVAFDFRLDETSTRRIAFTGDTSLFPQTEPPNEIAPQPISAAYPKPFCDKGACDLLVAHIGTITEDDLQGPIGILERTSQMFLPSIARKEGRQLREDVERKQASRTESRQEGRNHLRLGGVFAVLCGLQPKAAVISEFGEEMKTIWIKAVRAIETQLNKAVDTPISVFAGDPMLIYDIKEHKFLCHEDREFHAPEQLCMVGVHEDRDTPSQRHPRPYLFLASGSKEMLDPSDYEDKIREFHDKLKNRDLPHFKPNESERGRS